LKSQNLTKEEKLRLYQECEHSAQKAIRGFRDEHPRGAGANLFRFIVYPISTRKKDKNEQLMLHHPKKSKLNNFLFLGSHTSINELLKRYG